MITKHSSVPDRAHQLGVFIDFSANVLKDVNYWERAERFFCSLNHDKTIKADVYIVYFPPAGGVRLYAADSFNMFVSAEGALDAYGPSEPFPTTELREWALDRGHNTVSFFTGRTSPSNE